MTSTLECYRTLIGAFCSVLQNILTRNVRTAAGRVRGLRVNSYAASIAMASDTACVVDNRRCWTPSLSNRWQDRKRKERQHFFSQWRQLQRPWQHHFPSNSRPTVCCDQRTFARCEPCRSSTGRSEHTTDTHHGGSSTAVGRSGE